MARPVLQSSARLLALDRSRAWLAAAGAHAPCGTLFARSVKLRRRHRAVERYLVSLPRFHPAGQPVTRFLELCAALAVQVPQTLHPFVNEAVGFHIGIDPDDPDRGAVTKVYLEFCGALSRDPDLMYLAAKASARTTGIERYEALECRTASDWAGATRPFVADAGLAAASRALLDTMQTACGRSVFDPETVPMLLVHEPGTRRYSIDINYSNLDTPPDMLRILEPFGAIFDRTALDRACRRPISHVAIGLSHRGEPFVTLYGYPETGLGARR